MPAPNPSRIPVALIEDDVPYRHFIADLLTASGRFAIAAQAGSIEEASSWPADPAPTLCLVDIGLPHAPGTAGIQPLMKKFPGLAVIMLTARNADDSLLESIKAGAAGYVLKGTDSADLIDALDDALNGGAPMSPAIARRVLALMRESTAPGRVAPPANLPALTTREHQVIALVAAGATDKEAAAQLGVSLSAVKQHLANIYAKWRVRSRTEAAIKFTQAGR